MNPITPISMPSKSYDYLLWLPLIFLASLLFLNPQNVVAKPKPDQYLMANCITTFNYTAFSPFQNNLNRLLNRKLFNEGAISGFYNTSDGEYPDKVYGLFLCRGDVPPQDCQDCIDVAVQQIIQHCPGNKEALIWYDECLVRYANRSFFSAMESRPSSAWYNTLNVTQPHQFSDTLATMFENLTTVAISDPSMHLYATTEVNISSFSKLYGLVQCTPDLSPAYCKTCLGDAVDLIWNYSIEKHAGGRIFLPSCNIRFELYPFHRDPRVDARAPPPSSLVNTTDGGPRDSRVDARAPPPSTDGDPKERKGRKANWTAIGAGISGVLLSAICVYIIWRRIKSKQEDKESSQEVQLLGLGGDRNQDKYLNDHFHPETSQSQEFPSIPLDIVEAATKHFSEENKLGQGGFGPVYKGTLSDGKEIAVKRLSRTSGQGLVEFQNEIALIARLQHRNLVRLLGCCLEGNETLLIYEFMPNKSLDVFLFDSSLGVQLDWKKRFSIIKGIARGILYLHEDSRLRIIHRDLKASNVLLDQEMNPKISDFGMARIVGGNQIEGNTNRVVGTYGYMAPEYAMEGLFSIKSDVFSFGVLLLEIISGKRNNGFYLSENGHSLLTFAWKLWCGGEGLEVIDPLLVQSCVGAEVLKCIHIGLLCVQEDPADRPTMSSVVVMLGSETITLPQPREPAFSVGRVVAKTPADPWPNSITCSVNEVTCTNLSPR